MRKDSKLPVSLLLGLWGCLCAHPAPGNEPFKLGVEERGQVQSPPSYSTYPAPTMVAPPLQGNAHERNLQGGARKKAPMQASAQQHPPLSGTVTKTLPPSLLGSWLVSGNRTKVESQPEFQSAAEGAFAPSTTNVWTIMGDPQKGYTIGSDTGVNFQLWVDKVQGGVAFVRYQHPVKNTVAQEAIVMQLENGGTRFSGLERVSIVKEGQPPRAKVTYQLVGQRR